MLILGKTHLILNRTVTNNQHWTEWENLKHCTEKKSYTMKRTINRKKSIIDESPHCVNIIHENVYRPSLWNRYKSRRFFLVFLDTWRASMYRYSHSTNVYNKIFTMSHSQFQHPVLVSAFHYRTSSLRYTYAMFAQVLKFWLSRRCDMMVWCGGMVVWL